MANPFLLQAPIVGDELAVDGRFLLLQERHFVLHDNDGAVSHARQGPPLFIGKSASTSQHVICWRTKPRISARARGWVK